MSAGSDQLLDLHFTERLDGSAGETLQQRLGQPAEGDKHTRARKHLP